MRIKDAQRLARPLTFCWVSYQINLIRTVSALLRSCAAALLVDRIPLGIFSGAMQGKFLATDKRRPNQIDLVSAALGLSTILLAGSCGSSCGRPEPKAALVEQISQEPDLHPLSSLFFEGCSQKDLGETPVLYAHFLKNSANDNLDLKDLANREISSFACAPGPFLANEQEKASWALERMPNYFVWPTGHNSPDREQFYLTNQNGLPIKATTITMGSGKNRTVVLHPQAPWNKNEHYFIYQVLIRGKASTTWVQPLRAGS